jgi:methionyl-tRNA formyltransferase
MHAIIEERESWTVFLKRRANRLGLIKVLGQMLFHGLVVIPMMQRSKKRKQEIFEEYQMNPSPIPPHQMLQVQSINEPLVIQKIKEINPDLIIVNGTRIISKNHIAQLPCLAINTHAGITPKYRGVHGTYWALANRDPENSGVTVHQVDVGIDTGKIISQQRVLITPKDNFSTYPLLQLGEGLQLLENAIQDYFSNKINFIQGSGESKLWYHPTLWDYLKNRIVNKVK